MTDAYVRRGDELRHIFYGQSSMPDEDFIFNNLKRKIHYSEIEKLSSVQKSMIPERLPESLKKKWIDELMCTVFKSI